MSTPNAPSKARATDQIQPGAYELNTPAPSTGANPISAQVEFVDKEFNVSQIIQQQNIIDIGVSAQLPARKLYAAMWTNGTSATENWVLLRVDFWLNGTQVGSIPLSAGVTTSGTATALSNIIPSLLNGGGYPQIDDMTMTLDNPQTWSAVNAYLHPLRFVAQIDRITVSVVNFLNTSNLKVYLACFSYGSQVD